ncbi:MAG: hypothetical protein RJA78_273 [Actinomycetota bacterium]|jgi:hypothetical protein
MQGKFKFLVSAAITAGLALGGLAPAQAATGSITIGNAICEFDAAGQGRGSAIEPFLIKSALDLRELDDCYNRSKGVYTGIVNEDGTATFAVETNHGTFGIGQNVRINETLDGILDDEYATVVSATALTVTVNTKAPAGTVTMSGRITAFYTHVQLAEDINLGTPSTETWNNNTEISITGATKNSDGTITYQGENTLQGGETLFIDGMGDKRFNQGMVNIQSATPTEFVTNISFPLADGEATAAGGKAHFGGWLPVNMTRVDFDGAGHTISGLKVYRHANYIGLFQTISKSTVRNLKISNALVDTTSNYYYDTRERAGILAGNLENAVIDNVTIENSQVVAGGSMAGLLTGTTWASSVTNSSFSGSVKVNILTAGNDQATFSSEIGGVTGRAHYSTIKDTTVAVSVDGSTVTQSYDAEAVATPTNFSHLDYVGGIVGYADAFVHLEDVTSTGNVSGRSYIGGAIGQMNGFGSLRNVSASGNVTAKQSKYQTDEVEYVGGFVGSLNLESQSSNLTATGNVSVEGAADKYGAIRNIGGFAGYTSGVSSFKGVKSTGSVNVNQLGYGEVGLVGGLFGHSSRASITDSTSNSNVTIHTPYSNVYWIGGVIGYAEGGVTHLNNKHTGNVSVTIDDTSSWSAWDIGGYAGEVGSGSTFRNIASTGSVTVSNGHRIAGFAGQAGGLSIYSDIAVKGDVTNTYLGTEEYNNAANTAGLIGFVGNSITLNKVSVVGNVSATPVGESVANNVGGLIGWYAPGQTVLEILNSQYRGSVTGTNWVAGLVGNSPYETHIRLEKNLVVANVTATASNPKKDTVIRGFYRDGTRTNFVDSTVAGNSYNGALFIPTTTANLKLAATYTAKGWTFTGKSPWRINSAINDGYPYLLAPGTDETVVNPPVDPPAEIKYTTLKSLTFSKKVTALTAAQKKVLVALAKTISTSTYTVLQVEVTPSSADFAISGQRAAIVQAYLVAELKKLKSSKTIGISVVAKASGASAAIKVVGGK